MFVLGSHVGDSNMFVDEVGGNVDGTAQRDLPVLGVGGAGLRGAGPADAVGAARVPGRRLALGPPPAGVI